MCIGGNTAVAGSRQYNESEEFKRKAQSMRKRASPELPNSIRLSANPQSCMGSRPSTSGFCKNHRQAGRRGGSHWDCRKNQLVASSSRVPLEPSVPPRSTLENHLESGALIYIPGAFWRIENDWVPDSPEWEIRSSVRFEDTGEPSCVPRISKGKAKRSSKKRDTVLGSSQYLREKFRSRFETFSREFDLPRHLETVHKEAPLPIVLVASAAWMPSNGTRETTSPSENMLQELNNGRGNHR
ncbi:hypothetical protein B0H14DRAFT_2574126 [Mycena olivaceomarginata]|nr:hypothetical protein B0H14DRAFT_2574126 [Mycena olivaceomarginata]